MQQFIGVALAALLASFAVGSAQAGCAISSSACYPWRIEAGQEDTVLLEIVPNNVSTIALYRLCLCPPAKAVSLVFDFEGKQVTLGTVDIQGGETICRDYRIATARKSRLLLKRQGGNDPAVVEGCYTTQ